MIPVSILKSDIACADRRLDGRSPVVKPRRWAWALLALFFCTTIQLGAQSADEWFERGLDAFRWQKNEEAALYFRKAADADPTRDAYYLYLGICEHQLGRLDGAEESYSRGLALNGPQSDEIRFRRANLRWSMEDYDAAFADYDSLVEADGPLSTSALLNRGNMALVAGVYDRALEDYTRYLVLEPDAPDRETIERIIALLNADIEAARLAEARRIAEEQRRAEEEARRQALMAEVLESLSDSGEDTKSISAGTEDLREDFEDSALED